MGGTPILLIFGFIAVLMAMGAFFDFLAKVSARVAREAKEQAEAQRHARAGGQPATTPPPALAELERFLRGLIEPAGGGAAPAAPPPPTPGRPVLRARPVGPAGGRARPAQAPAAPAAAGGRLTEHHLDPSLERRHLDPTVARRQVTPGVGQLADHHLQGSLGAEAAPAIDSRPRTFALTAQATVAPGLARLDRLPPLARAVALTEVLGPPPGLGRGPRGPRRRFTRAVDA